MRELTREELKSELESLEENKLFNVASEDSGSIYFALYGCKVNICLEEGLEGEITIFKPNTDMGITFDFEIINVITKENRTSYRMEFNNGISDIVIDVVNQMQK